MPQKLPVQEKRKTTSPTPSHSPHPDLPPSWGKTSTPYYPMYRTTLPTTAGAGVPSDISEVALIYRFGHEAYELCRSYTASLPRAKDGIFLIFPGGDNPQDVTIPLRFDVLQVCHVLLDQSQLKAGQDYTVSNQVTIYVEPHDITAHDFCNKLVLQLHADEMREAAVEAYKESRNRS